MKEVFDSINVSVWQFASSSLYFLLTMIGFFLLKKKSQQWLNYAFLGSFALYWLITVAGHNTSEYKMLVSLLLVSTLIIEALVKKRRKAEAQQS